MKWFDLEGGENTSSKKSKKFWITTSLICSLLVLAVILAAVFWPRPVAVLAEVITHDASSTAYVSKSNDIVVPLKLNVNAINPSFVDASLLSLDVAIYSTDIGILLGNATLSPVAHQVSLPKQGAVLITLPWSLTISATQDKRTTAYILALLKNACSGNQEQRQKLSLEYSLKWTYKQIGGATSTTARLKRSQSCPMDVEVDSLIAFFER